MYKKPSDIIQIENEKIPKLIHRTLLYDLDFPNNVKNYINEFHQQYPNYQIILWRN